MTFSLGMMQTAANEGEAMEEKKKRGQGASVCGVCVCVCVFAGAFGISGQNI